MTSQRSDIAFFETVDTFSQRRFNTALGFGLGTYATLSTGLYFAWYRQYPQSSFRLFDDSGEWLDMDKGGHVYSAYFQSVICYQGAKWTGLSEQKSILTGVLAAGLFQTTIEVMDGFSEEWGFSIPDVAANTIGIATFAIQQKYWGEQRLRFKVSTLPDRYPSFPITGSEGTVISSRDRTDDLFGSSYLETYLKDYNTQSYWLSCDIKSFLPEGNTWPDWLDFAIGYGGENMYGGYTNTWQQGSETFTVDADLYPRTRQYFIGLDLDLTGIKTKNSFLSALLRGLNIFRVPAPALEINSRGEFTFHLLR